MRSTTVSSSIVNDTCSLEKEIQQLTFDTAPSNAWALAHTHTHASISVDQRKNVTWQGNRYFQTELLGNALAR